MNEKRIFYMTYVNDNKVEKGNRLFHRDIDIEPIELVKVIVFNSVRSTIEWLSKKRLFGL